MMPIDVFEALTHPVTGETVRCLTADENVYAFEWTVAPGGCVPFEHVHYFQDETFFIQRGEVRVMIEGRETIGKPGDQLTVLQGQRHIALNNSDDVLKCRVEFRPGFDTKTVMQCFWGLILDGDYDRHGAPSILKMGYFINGCKALTRPTNIPAPLFSFCLNLFYLIGKIAGWKKLFHRYTGRQK
jgi:quercetin dioxygenase-like cupin family protein